MRPHLLVVVSALIATQVGCGRLFATEYDSIDAACTDRFPGDDLIAATARVYLRRVNCYRRFVNLPDLRVTEAIQEAAQNHARYLEENGIVDDPTTSFGDLHAEKMNLPFATGANALSRLEFTEAVSGNESYGAWSAFFGDFSSDIVDSDITDPFWRDVLFQPGMEGMGLEQVLSASGSSAYGNVLYRLGGSQRIDWPVVYPRDNQSNVGLTWDVGEATALFGPPVVGFPITITLGASESTAGSNPYQARLIEATITDESGSVIPYQAVMPQHFQGGGDLINTIIFAPQIPLKSDTQYTLDAVIGWNAYDEFEVQSSFTTLRVGSSSPSTPVDTDTGDDPPVDPPGDTF